MNSFVRKTPNASGIISTLYSHALAQSGIDKPPYVRKWEEDLGRELDNSDWNQIWNTTKTASPNIQAVEANYKVLTRWYLVPARIAKYAKNYSAQCFRGCSDIGIHFHTWWSCPKVQIFWIRIFKIASILSGKNIPLDPATALLNLKPEGILHSQFKLLLQLFTAAKQALAKAWRSSKLVVNEAVTKMNNTMTHPKMLAIDTDMIPQFVKMWKP